MIKDVNFDLVGNLIIKLRENYGLTQQELAKEINVSKGAVCQWEQGAGIKTENLYDIAKFFNITVAELIDGQLVEEEDDDYFERNYNLDDFAYFKEVDDSNYEDLLEYLKRCKNVIKRFMYLYPLHKENKLTKKQNIEYHKMSHYFEVDYPYAEAINLGAFISSIDNAVEELTGMYDIQNNTDLDYMLYKLFHLVLKVDPISVLEYENDDVAANEYLELIGKEGRDSLLTNIVSDMDEDDIENSVVVKKLIEAGARCFFTRKDIQNLQINEIDEDVFKQLKGVHENKIIQDRYDFFKQEEQTKHIFEMYDPYSWKNYNKANYEYLINKEKTDFIRDVVLLKENDPMTFYKNLVERSKNHLEDK